MSSTRVKPLSQRCGRKVTKLSSVSFFLECAGFDAQAKIKAAKVKERNSIALASAAVTLNEETKARL